MKCTTRRIAALLAIPALALGGTLLAAGPAPAATPVEIVVQLVLVVADAPQQVQGQLNGTTLGADDSMWTRNAAAGQDVGTGSLQVQGNGGTVPFAIPITVNVGHLTNGEQVVVMVNDTETANGVQVGVTSTTKTVTCNLDASGNGTCS
ncbi:hypothetical protein [Nocardia terpenica]|uniref:Uncharacterized protein n=1 Tax=Nocardia terpenica TaxID=455432 RepID=A0A6G9ZDU0_9NOCA|nr:hypothetical protein [Nocardia terpenica]QIS23571.1 hypothetical protein F6W96_40145 [Nocardia terpenica]